MNTDIQQQILETLETNYKITDRQFIDPIIVCEQLESFLPELIAPFLHKIIQEHFSSQNIRFLVSAYNVFVIDDQLYELSFGNLQTKFITSIVNKTPGKKPARTRKFDLPIQGGGRYNEVQLHCDTIFLPLHEFLLGIIKDTVETVYRWLEVEIETYLHFMQQGAVDDLYQYLRIILPSTLVDKIWLYAIIKQKGIYVLDLLARQSAIRTASERDQRLTISPLELSVIFQTTPVEFKETFTKAAVERDEPVGGDFTTPPYIATGIQLAEMEIYQDKYNVVQPLVREGEILLAAGYPQDLRDKVEQLLYSHRDDIRLRLQQKKTAYDRIVEFLGSKYKLVEGVGFLERIAGIAGKFFGSATRSFMEG